LKEKIKLGLYEIKTGMKQLAQNKRRILYAGLFNLLLKWLNFCTCYGSWFQVSGPAHPNTHSQSFFGITVPTVPGTRQSCCLRWRSKA